MTDIDIDNFSEKKKKKQNQKYFAIINLFLAVISLTLLIFIFTKIASLIGKDDNPSFAKQHVIQVEVLNGCGAAGLANKFTDFLRSKKFDVIKTGNFSSFDIDYTFLIDRVGKKEFAYAVADSLGIMKANVIQQANKYYYLDVTLVIGKDFNKFLNH